MVGSGGDEVIVPAKVQEKCYWHGAPWWGIMPPPPCRCAERYKEQAQPTEQAPVKGNPKDLLWWLQYGDYKEIVDGKEVM